MEQSPNESVAEQQTPKNIFFRSVEKVTQTYLGICDKVFPGENSGRRGLIAGTAALVLGSLLRQDTFDDPQKLLTLALENGEGLIEEPDYPTLANLVKSVDPFIEKLGPNQLTPSAESYGTQHKDITSLKQKQRDKYFRPIAEAYGRIHFKDKPKYQEYLRTKGLDALVDSWFDTHWHFPLSGHLVQAPDEQYLQDILPTLISHSSSERSIVIKAGEEFSDITSLASRECIARKLIDYKYKDNQDLYTIAEELREIGAEQQIEYAATKHGVSLFRLRRNLNQEEFIDESPESLAVQILEKKEVSKLLVEQEEEISSYIIGLLTNFAPEYAKNIENTLLHLIHPTTWEKRFSPESTEYQTIKHAIGILGWGFSGFADYIHLSDKVYVTMASYHPLVLMSVGIHEIAHRLPDLIMTGSNRNDFMVGFDLKNDTSQPAYSKICEVMMHRIQQGLLPVSYWEDKYKNAMTILEKIDLRLTQEGLPTSMDVFLASQKDRFRELIENLQINPEDDTEDIIRQIADDNLDVLKRLKV